MLRYNKIYAYTYVCRYIYIYIQMCFCLCRLNTVYDQDSKLKRLWNWLLDVIFNTAV